MRIRIIRMIKEEKRTIGALFINDKFICYTLEDAVRKEKINGKTAIPEGVYEVRFIYSNRFKKIMPYILGIENYSGVLFHAGNTEEDTEGCILLGTNYNENGLLFSRVAFSKFLQLLPSYQSIYDIRLFIESVDNF